MSPRQEDIESPHSGPAVDDTGAPGEPAGPAQMPPRVGRREPYDTGESLPLESRRHGPLEAPPRLSGEQQRRARRRKAAFTIAGVLVAVVMVASAVAALVWIRGLEHELRFPTAVGTSLDRALTTVHSGVETYTVLALGVDGTPTDSQPIHAVMLLRVTPDKVSALSIAPDLAVRPQVSQTATQIAGSDSTPEVAALGDIAKIGGYPAVVDTVERMTEAPVNHLVVLRFSSLSRMVDRLGSVWTTMPAAISDPAIGAEGGAPRIDAGRQLLDGAKTITLVRALPEGDTQTGLMARQRQFLDSLVTALASAKGGQLLGPRLAASLGGGLVSDMSSRQLLVLLSRLQDASPAVESASLWGTGQTGLKQVDPAVVDRLVTAFTSGSDLAKASPKPPAVAPPSSVIVTVRNGSGTSGLAAQAASILKGKGFRVSEVGNADQFVYDETLIVYKSDARKAAESISKALPVGRLVAGRGMYAFETPVLVIVGKDWQTAPPKTDPVPIEQP